MYFLSKTKIRHEWRSLLTLDALNRIVKSHKKNPRLFKGRGLEINQCKTDYLSEGFWLKL